jgi:hypothetical protein
MRFLDYLKRFTYTPNEFYDYLKLLEDAAGGDVELVIFPAMTGTPATGPALEPTATEANDGYAFDVTLQVMNKAKTKVMEWYNGTLEVDVVPDSSAGTIVVNDDETPSGTTVTKNMAFVNGVCKFTVTMGDTWAADDTVKVTVDDDDVGIMGYTVEKTNHLLVKVKADPVPGG